MKCRWLSVVSVSVLGLFFASQPAWGQCSHQGRTSHASGTSGSGMGGGGGGSVTGGGGMGGGGGGIFQMTALLLQRGMMNGGGGQALVQQNVALQQQAVLQQQAGQLPQQTNLNGLTVAQLQAAFDNAGRPGVSVSSSSSSSAPSQPASTSVPTLFQSNR
jgi:hypothetical protein